jgi:hypothetical protein
MGLFARERLGGADERQRDRGRPAVVCGGALVQELRQLGWAEGQNVRIDVRWNAGDARLARIYAAQLIGLMPDVIAQWLFVRYGGRFVFIARFLPFLRNMLPYLLYEFHGAAERTG